MRDAAAKFRQDPMSRDLEIRVSLLAPFALGTFQCLADITIGALSARSATPIFFVAATVKSSEKGGTGKGGVSRNLWRGYQCGIRRKERNIKRPRERMSNGIRGVSAREEEKKKEKERSVDEVGKVRKARTNRERERERRGRRVIKQEGTGDISFFFIPPVQGRSRFASSTILSEIIKKRLERNYWQAER